MIDTCQNCTRSCQIDHRRCGFCGSDLGFPNVRFALRAEEASALSDRYETARRAAENASASTAFARLETLAAGSLGVINRNLRQVSHWLYSDNRLYQSFFKRRQNNVPYAQDDFNLQRISAENTVSPIFFDQLIYAALSLDGRGMDYYGEYTVVLRDEAIRGRSTVFVENPFAFTRRHRIISGQMAPAGYRAAWFERGRLVCAKLGDRLAGDEADGDLAELVMTRDRGAADCDYVEVHVYGDILVDAIATITGPVPGTEADRVAWERMRKDFSDHGVTLQVAA